MDSLRAPAEEVDSVTEPTTWIGDVRLFHDAAGLDGRPCMMHLEDPPNTTRPAHWHRSDVVYFYVRGTQHIDGEGTYQAGDVRWARAGRVYGRRTTGPEGSAWWAVSDRDPAPVDVAPPGTPARLPRFDAPYDWATIDAAVQDEGAAVVEGLVDHTLREAFLAGIDKWIAQHPDAGAPHTGFDRYDRFWGLKTRRLHGLVAKTDAAVPLVAHRHILGWARRMLAPVGQQILLNAGELIDIGPGESAQTLHRDNDSWLALPRSEHSVLVLAMVALTEFTEATGATNVAPGSHLWARGRRPEPQEIAVATMEPGDVLLFRGDILHSGGANLTTGTTRRGLSLSYVTSWLRPLEASLLNVPPHLARTLPTEVADLLGYAAIDRTDNSELVGLYELGSPRLALTHPNTNAAPSSTATS